MKRFSLSALAMTAALVVLPISQARSELLFKDTFDVSAPSDDLNFENATRQSGPLRPLTYTVTGNGVAQLGQADALNRLKFTTPTVLVSPDHNFTEGSRFNIDFDVDPGVNDASSASTDWAAIVFGATTQNAFVNGSDGMGVLFRNNGGIQVFDGGTAVYTGSGDVTVPTNALFHVQIEVDAAGFGSSATVRMFINGQQARMDGNSLEHVKNAGFRGNYITLLGYSGPADQWVHLFDNLEVNASGCIDFLSHRIETRTGEMVEVTVQVPPAFVTNAAATVKVIARNPSVAVQVGAVNNELTLTFAPGGPYATNVQINVVGVGVGTLELTNNSGFCVGQPLTIIVGSAFVRNPSFEKNYNPGFPHYSSIDDWITIDGTGVNDVSGPFHDSGMIPDQSRVAFIQGTKTLSQMVSG